MLPNDEVIIIIKYSNNTFNLNDLVNKVINKKIISIGRDSFIPSRYPFFNVFLPRKKLLIKNDNNKRIIFIML